MDDDWKGEGFIRAGISEKQRKSEAQRVISMVYHEKRRAKGDPAPAAARHSKFMRVALAQAKEVFND